MSMNKKNVVDSTTYRLTAPGEFKALNVKRNVMEGEVVIEPTLSSICHADLRYFTGNRRPEALAKKLPMALLHEGIGTVVKSRSTKIKTGQKVVIVPNLPGYILQGVDISECCPPCRNGVGESYCERGEFMGSGFDGIAQSRLVIPDACAIPIPDGMDDEVAVLAELCSVSYHGLNHVRSRLKNSQVAVFGDGPVGFLTAAMIHHMYGLEKGQLKVFGAIEEKLAQFDFAETHLVQHFNFQEEEKVDIAIECTGGNFSESAINQAIDHLTPGGNIVLMGVSEEKVPINTRDVLERGLSLFGSSRSSIADYQAVLSAMKDKRYQQTLKKLLPSHNNKVETVEDFKSVMEETANYRGWKKVFIEFDWSFKL